MPHAHAYPGSNRSLAGEGAKVRSPLKRPARSASCCVIPMMHFSSENLLASGLWILCVGVTAVAVRSIHRLYFHPLCHFPGPRLAVLTTWYRGYYDVLLGGAWLRHLEGLHEIYGDVVRIGPNELHFSSPRAYATIYATGSPFTKEPGLYRCFGMDDGSFGIVDPQKAKRRREMLLSLFSRRAIFKLESVIQEKVNTLIKRILAHGAQPIDLSLAFRCTTFDTIADYCFAHSFDALHAPMFQHSLLINMQGMIEYFWILKHFPVILTLANLIPPWVAERASPLYREFDAVRAQIKTTMDGFIRTSETGAGLGRIEDWERETVFHHLIQPRGEADGKKVVETPSRKALLDEAVVLLQAGSDTVGHVCIIGTYHALRNREILGRLVHELSEAWPDKETNVGYNVLEKLPYLTAFIKESLRTSHGVITPLARVVPTKVSIAGYTVPPRTVVSSGSTFMHNNAEVFPDPFVFDPERWLKPKEEVRELENHLVPFSRGPRMCLGFNLAWCELYLIFANFFRKLDLEIYKTTKEDFAYKEIFVPIRSGKLRAIARERE